MMCMQYRLLLLCFRHGGDKHKVWADQKLHASSGSGLALIDVRTAISMLHPSSPHRITFPRVFRHGEVKLVRMLHVVVGNRFVECKSHSNADRYVWVTTVSAPGAVRLEMALLRAGNLGAMYLGNNFY